MIKIINILRWIKKYAIQLSIILVSFYACISTYKIFVNYENYQYTHDLAANIIHKTTDDLPLAKSDAHKFVNAILESSDCLSGFSEFDSFIINQSANYTYPFTDIEKFNILKEIVTQHLLMKMTPEEQHAKMMSDRTFTTHTMLRRFVILRNEVRIPIIYNTKQNPEGLILSLLINRNDPEA